MSASRPPPATSPAVAATVAAAMDPDEPVYIAPASWPNSPGRGVPISQLFPAAGKRPPATPLSEASSAVAAAGLMRVADEDDE